MVDYASLAFSRSDYSIICGDAAAIVPTLPRARMVFADPPDNTGQPYQSYEDLMPDDRYTSDLSFILGACRKISPVVWWSVPSDRQANTWHVTSPPFFNSDIRMFVWYYTFGQHRSTDCGRNYRCLFRVSDPRVQWHTDPIRIPSARQEKYNDSRADPRGRVPGDVWEIPRVCGTHKERRSWHPNQHPEALVERCILMSTVPGDLVIDPFLGSGTTLRVCRRLGRPCIGIDIDPATCERVSAETGVPVSTPQ